MVPPSKPEHAAGQAAFGLRTLPSSDHRIPLEAGPPFAKLLHRETSLQLYADK